MLQITKENDFPTEKCTNEMKMAYEVIILAFESLSAIRFATKMQKKP